jgi:hypothetical protein
VRHRLGQAPGDDRTVRGDVVLLDSVAVGAGGELAADGVDPLAEGGGSPDMGGVSADGRVFWISGRYNGVVYAISTRNGKLLARIPVANGPHGVCIYPIPGRYSLGHTDNMR